jgi:S1/P1 Nuclease
MEYGVKGIFVFLWIIAGFGLFQCRVFAWDGAGHMLIAAEAFRQLSPELQAQAIEVLKAHPDYDAWIKSYHPNPTFSRGAFVFMCASMWPDEIRGSGSPYDHPEWHFIDYPLRPPHFFFEADPRPTNNVLFGIAQCEKTLSNPDADPELRAAYLSFLIHLIGDMHQPLHCCSLFTTAYPYGDRGGNDFFVRLDGQGVRLHGIWDGLLGTQPVASAQWEDSLRIEAEYPRSSLPELTKDTTPKEWSLESRELAIQYGYLNGHLKGSTKPETAPPLPPGYIAAATAVAERRGALAGYRLADEIREYLKVGKSVPLLPPNTDTVAEVLPNEIGPAQAANYYYSEMTVTGKVVEVSVHRTIALLNLDKPSPDSPLTAAVFSDNFGRFGDFQKYQGQDVKIQGAITDYHNRPEVILESANQIQIVPSK